MFSKKVLIALSLPFMFSLTACGGDGGDGGDGGGGDANQNVVRNIFAVGDILEAREDTSGVTGCQIPVSCQMTQTKSFHLLLKVARLWRMDHFLFVRMAPISIHLASYLLVLSP